MIQTEGGDAASHILFLLAIDSYYTANGPRHADVIRLPIIR